MKAIIPRSQNPNKHFGYHALFHQTIEAFVEPIKTLTIPESRLCEFFQNGCVIPKLRACFLGYSGHCQTLKLLKKYGIDYNRFRK